MFEDFDVLHNFSGKVGDIVDRTIDQPFYEDMDAFVEAMRDLSISNYTTTNRIGATEIVQSYAGYGVPQQFEIDKAEVSLDDLLSGDTFYGEQMKLEYEAWKELNPDQDFSQKEYQQAIVNTRAFGYESIRDTQENKEFWFQIGALVVIVGTTLICPPAGIALGAAYGAYELTSALSGKDLVSGRELDTSERWVRGLLAPLDIVPGAGVAVTKFAGSGAAGLARIGGKVVPTGLKTSVSEGVQKGVTCVKNLAETATNFGAARLKSAGTVIQNRANMVINKAKEGTIEGAKLADKAITVAKNLDPRRIKVMETTLGNKVIVHDPAENTHTFANKISDIINRNEGVNLKGAGEGSITKEVKEIDFGKNIIKGEKGKKQLLPNIQYVTNDSYKYTTDELGRIVNVEAPELVLKKADRNKYAQANIGGKDRLPDDDGGHLIGAQFNGPPDIDNLVPQNSQINRRGGVWYEMETEWANALKEIPPKKVSVSIDPIYSNNSMRPDSFMVQYEIEDQFPVIREIANKSGG